MKKKLLLFSFALLAFVLGGCSKQVTKENTKVEINGSTYNVVYTGELKFGKPVGNGTAVISDYTIDFDGVDITGTYNGSVESGCPDGDGKFESDSDDYTFKYSGEWEDGIISGKGKLEYSKYIVHFEELDREGNYNGETLDGQASGYGIFSATTDYGENYTQEGEWKKGVPEGFGRRIFEDGVRYVGIYKKGDLEETLVNLLYTMSDYEDDMPFTVSDEEVEFIENHSNFFSTDDLSVLASYIDEDLDYKKIEKQESAYNDSLMIVDPAYVVQIESFEGLNGGMVTTMILSDEDDNIHYLIYPAEATDIYSGDYIGCVAYPIGFTSYENVRKTTTKCTVLLGCFVTK